MVVHYLWRAVDQDGDVLDILIQRRRDQKAAKKFLRKLLKTLHSVGDITRHQRLKDNDIGKFSPKQMLAELCVDNQHLTRYLRSAHVLCEQHRDIATASLIETWLDEGERRTWFLSEVVGD